MKTYRVIKIDKYGKSARKDESADALNSMQIRHKVKIVKPWKTLRKLWTFWL